MASFFGGTTAGGSATNAATEKDIEVSDPPSDSISCLAWSPAADFLAAGSWDGNVRLHTILPFEAVRILTFVSQVRIWEINGQGQSQGKAMYSHSAPVLSICWNKVRDYGY
jgi:mRNA export factor